MQRQRLLSSGTGGMRPIEYLAIEHGLGTGRGLSRAGGFVGHGWVCGGGQATVARMGLGAADLLGVAWLPVGVVLAEGDD
jgi:hypothetical protein